MRSGGAHLAVALVLALAAGDAGAQTRRPADAPTPTAAGPGLRARLGVPLASQLLRSADVEERLRGVERAAALHTPEALALLEHAVGATLPGAFDPRGGAEGVARTDPRALLAAVRGLATWTDRESAREALTALLLAPTQSFTMRVPGLTSNDPSADEAESAARVMLAREQAAIALASSSHPAALEALVKVARAGGPGQDAALEALALVPPVAPILGGVALTTPPMILLAARTGDLRSIDAVLGALSASDAGLRAAALAALGDAADSRARAPSLEGIHDKDPRVRIAAAGALARLGAPEAGPAVEALIADDLTAAAGLELAALVQQPGVVRAAAARAAASADDSLRAAALVALGSQADPLAVSALSTLASDLRSAGDAARALAASPAAGAMSAIEALAEARATLRLAARAYVVRRLALGERSARMDDRLAAMGTSPDPADRAVGLQALVMLGLRPASAAMGDPDPLAQRAVAMGALALAPADRAAALARTRDPLARRCLAALDDTPPVASPLELFEQARSSAPEAPRMALALARRNTDDVAPLVDALLASRDPLLRAAAARGLGEGTSPEGTGRLARAYTFEPDVAVRRALLRALAARVGEREAPARREALALAAWLEPDRVARAMAARAVEGLSPAPAPRAGEVAWLRVVPAPGAQGPADLAGLVVGADGAARIVLFDGDGYALVPGLPAGEALLRLAPRVRP